MSLSMKLLKTHPEPTIRAIEIRVRKNRKKSKEPLDARKNPPESVTRFPKIMPGFKIDKKRTNSPCNNSGCT